MLTVENITMALFFVKRNLVIHRFDYFDNIYFEGNSKPYSIVKLIENYNTMLKIGKAKWYTELYEDGFKVEREDE